MNEEKDQDPEKNAILARLLNHLLNNERNSFQACLDEKIRNYDFGQEITIAKNVITDPSYKNFIAVTYDLAREGKVIATLDINHIIHCLSRSRMKWYIDKYLWNFEQDVCYEKPKDDEDVEHLRKIVINLLEITSNEDKRIFEDIFSERNRPATTFDHPTMISYEEVPEIHLSQEITPAHLEYNNLYGNFIDFLKENYGVHIHRLASVACLRPEKTSFGRDSKKALKLKDIKSPKRRFISVGTTEGDREHYELEELLENKFSEERKKLYLDLDDEIQYFAVSQDMTALRNVVYAKRGDLMQTPIVLYDFYDKDGRKSLTIDINAFVVKTAREHVWDFIQLQLKKRNVRKKELNYLRRIFSDEDPLYNFSRLSFENDFHAEFGSNNHYFSIERTTFPPTYKSPVIIYHQEHSEDPQVISKLKNMLEEEMDTPLKCLQSNMQQLK